MRITFNFEQLYQRCSLFNIEILPSLYQTGMKYIKTCLIKNNFSDDNEINVLL